MGDGKLAQPRKPLAKYAPKLLGPKLWGTELLVVELPFAIGKVMTMKAGYAGPLQFHNEKHEAFYLYKGVAQVTKLNDAGTLETVEVQSGETWIIPPGAVHKVAAVEECVMFEVSNPVFDDRVPYEP